MSHLNSWRQLVMLASLCLIALPASAHEGAGDDHHHHDDATSEHSHGKFLTTRNGARVLPLAKEEDVFHFVIYGDRTGGVPAGLAVLEQAVRDTNLLDPDLVMTVGDLIQGYNDTPEWLEQMSEYQEIMNRLNMRWFPVAGNHDVYWRGEGKSPQGQHESNYEKHFGPLWYTFRHKNAGFVVLFSDEGDAETNEKGFNQGRLQTMSPEQLAFLDQALESHRDLDHVMVFLHHPRWIGRGYAGGNWDLVHEKLKAAGNVTAVFAGHIHQMRFDGPKDGIAYYTLATTGGHLSADLPGAGYLHHLNVVTVRPDDLSVAAIPIGAVIDPKEFTPEFLADIGKARGLRARVEEGELLLQIDGSAAGEVTFSVTNPCAHDLEITASLNPAASDWTTTVDHHHFTLAPGATEQLVWNLRREAGSESELSLPQLQLEREYIGQTARISLPPVATPIPLQLAAVPADYFSSADNHCLVVTGENAAVRVDSSALDLPDGPFTLEAWVDPEQTAGNRGLIAKTERSEFAFFMNEGVPQFDVHLNGRYVSAKAQDVLPVQTWSHLAGVFDGSTVKLYVNGKLVGSRPGEGRRTRNELPLYVGADTNPEGQPVRSFLGRIDEVRISQGIVYADEFTPQRRLEPLENTRLLFHFDRHLGPFVLDHSETATKGMLGPDSELVPVDHAVLFQDDFEAGHSRWEMLDPATWKLTEREGNRTLEIIERGSAYQPPVRSPGHVALIEDLELGSFDITFRVRSTQDTGDHRDCCVFFGYQDDQHFYYAHLGAKPDPYSGQIMIVNEAPRLAITENAAPVPWDDQWHTVRLTRQLSEGKIEVYFDDMTQPLMSVTDPTFGAGRVGIGSFDDMNEFDDVIVRRLDD